MQIPPIHIDVGQDDLAPVASPVKGAPELCSSSDSEGPKPPQGCGDPECPVCRWEPVLQEIQENLHETDVFMNVAEGGYPLGRSFYVLPLRVNQEESTALGEFFEGLEEAHEEERSLVIPANRVPTILAALDGVLEEGDDFVALTVINDRMLLTSIAMLGKALNPKTEEDRQAAEAWYSNMREQDPQHPLHP